MNIDVAVAVFLNTQGEVLIAKRLPHQFYGGYWEFPGGKVEPGEAIEAALQRECLEEVNLSIQKKQKLTHVPYDHSTRHVALHVWLITAFSGDAHGKEGQTVKWVKPETLGNYEFPPANIEIVKSLTLALRSI